jgi:hypothetical protein
MRSLRLPYIPLLITVLASSMLSSCATRPVSLSPEIVAPSALLPIVEGGIRDGRGRFREIYREVLAA